MMSAGQCKTIQTTHRRGPSRNREFQLKWESVIRDWSVRWGKKVVGWWFDSCYWPNAMYRFPEPPNFESFAAAARAGNTDSVVAFNPGVVGRLLSIAPQEDYTAGEINEPDRVLIRRVVNGKVDGAQPHVLTFLGEIWGWVRRDSPPSRLWGGAVRLQVPAACSPWTCRSKRTA